jgi:hypothetical protein
MEPAHFERRVFVRKCDRRVDERCGRAASSTAFIDGLLPVSIRCATTTPEPRWLCHDELLPNVRQPASLLEWVDGHDLPPRVAAVAIENAVGTGRAGMHRPIVHESHATRLGIDVTNAKAAVLTLGDGKPVANGEADANVYGSAELVANPSACANPDDFVSEMRKDMGARITGLTDDDIPF